MKVSVYILDEKCARYSTGRMRRWILDSGYCSGQFIHSSVIPRKSTDFKIRLYETAGQMVTAHLMKQLPDSEIPRQV
jgi:hypothetical protein